MKNKIFKALAISLLTVSLAACSKVPAGYVGVKVYLLGSDKGVDNEELPTGRYWIGMNEELYLFPTFTQNYVWTKNAAEGSPNNESISFQSMEGLPVNADVGISYSIDPKKVTLVFQKYRRGVDEITDTFLRNEVRDALVQIASTKPIEYVYGAGKAELINQAKEMVRKEVEPIGIRVENLYWIGEIRLPDNVVKSINAKVGASQMALQRQNEVQQSKFEADKKIAEAHGTAESIKEIAVAQAEANRILSESLTDNLVKYKMIEKWNGQLPKFTTSSGVLFNMALDDIENSKK